MDFHKNIVIATQLFAETLPISSSTHVWLVDFFWTRIFKTAIPYASEPIMDILFLPTLLVLIFYFKSHTQHLVRSLYKFITRPRPHHLRWLSILIRISGYLIASTLTFTAVFYSLRFLIGPGMKYVAGPDAWIAQAVGLGITCCLQLSTYFVSAQHQHETALTPTKAIAIGFLQGFAALPGISRLSITLVTARLLHVPPHRAFEFSTLLQITLFLGNIVKNILFPTYAVESATGIAAYQQILSSFSWDNIIVITIFTIASYYGLRFTKKLNCAKTLWKISPYFMLPIGALLLFH